MSTTDKTDTDTFTEDCTAIQHAIYDLAEWSRAFAVTGNEVMGDHLRAVADTLQLSLNRIRSRDFAISRERTADAQRASANLLSGVLAGIDIGEKAAKG